MSSVPYLMRKEFAQLRRDHRMLPIVFVAPVMQLLILGYAANLDVKDLRLMVLNSDQAKDSRELVTSLTASGYFVDEGSLGSRREIYPLLQRGEADLVLVIPRDFSEDVEANRRATVQLLADGSDSNTAGIGLNYASLALQSPQGTGGAGGVILEERVFYNPGLESRDFFVPGIVGLLLMLMTMMLTSLALVKEKEQGTMEQLIVTPLRPWEILLGKLLPFTVIGFVDALLALGAAFALFGLGVRGSVFLLLGLCAIFLLTTLGLGLFISTVVRTQQQAMMASVFFVLLPMIFLSGFIFPVESMPLPIQYLSLLMPPRYFFVILRGIYLKGAGFAELWKEGLALLVLGIGIFALSLTRFRKRLAV